MNPESVVKAQEGTQEKSCEAEKPYEKPTVKTLNQRDILAAVCKGSKFPARGFAG